MIREYLLFTLISVSIMGIGLGTVWTGATASCNTASQSSAKMPARTLDPVLGFSRSETIELKAQAHGTILTITADNQGNLYLLQDDFSAPKGRGFSIQKIAPDGTFLGSVPLRPEIWEPPVLAYDLSVGKEGTLYTAVEWPIKQGGIIAVDDNGTLRSKLTFSDFVPRRMAVDGQGKVWVAGQEVDPLKVFLATHRIPVDPKKSNEQLRIYTPDLKFLDMPVRNQKVGTLPSSLTTSGDEVVYYASGTETIWLFRQGQLVHSLTLPQLTPIAPPVEVLQGGFNTERAVTGVYKIGDRFLIAGVYNYISTPRDNQWRALLVRRFIALVSTDGDAASPEFEPPNNALPWAYSEGHLITISGSSGSSKGSLRLTKITRMRPKI